MSEITNSYQTIIKNIDKLSEITKTSVCLVAISKTKPIENIIELYNCGQRYFGENYVNELEMKANNPLILSQCPDIRWHFVGHLQSNKINHLLTRVPNLDCIQTVDSIDLATRLNRNLKEQSKTLKLLIQINTSSEQQKSGISRMEFMSLYEHINMNCQQLIFQGLMTIGSLDNVNNDDDSDFKTLKQCRDELCDKYNLSKNDIQLSMGMSNDYERAIQLGSTIVRIGSLIFGSR